jgi:hypothetical protein
LLLAAAPAFAQDPVVTAADPDMAEQETYDLVVKISGSNFGVDSQVDFFVAGTTNPGGIHVTNVKRKNPKTLEATIDVAPDAAVELFDIEVRSNGRTGKGTELFRVLEKTTGGGTLPPGAVTELTVLDVDISGVLLSWTSPADNGYDVASGPVAGFKIKVRRGGPFTPALWEIDENNLSHIFRPTNMDPWPGPGDTARFRVTELSPGTEYWLAVRAWDGQDLYSEINQIAVLTDPFPASDWSAEEVAACGSGEWIAGVDLELDPDGAPAMVYGLPCEGKFYLARRSGIGWTFAESPGGDLAFDPSTGQAMIVEDLGAIALWRQTGTTWDREVVERRKAGRSSLAVGANGPVLAYGYEFGPSLRIAQRLGGAWQTTEIPLPRSMNARTVPFHLALDGDGWPAVVFGEDLDGNAFAEVVKLATWDGEGWQVEVIETCDSGWALGQGDLWLAWDPARADFSVAYSSVATVGLDRIRVCDREGAGNWSCASPPVHEELPALYLVALLVDGSGAAHLAYLTDWSVLVQTTRVSLAAPWSSPEPIVSGVGPYIDAVLTASDEPFFATTNLPLEPGVPSQVLFVSESP